MVGVPAAVAAVAAAADGRFSLKGAFMKKLLRWAVGLLLAFALAGWGFSHGLIVWTVDWKNPVPIFDTGTVIHRIESNGEKLVADLVRHSIDYVCLDEMPEHLVQAFVAVEDRRFYQHRGVDFRGVFRALFVNIRDGSIAQGGSTITQQLARTLFLSQQQSLERKLAEASIALQLERRYDKDSILEMYLNQIYFGAGNWGVAQAARDYFGKHVSELSLSESALLAGVVAAPSVYAPTRNWDLALQRQRTVLSRMVEMEYITPQQAREAEGLP